MGEGRGTTTRRAADWALALFLSALAGCLLAWALPTRGGHDVSWFALAPLFIAARRTKPAAAFALALLSAAVAGWMTGSPWGSLEESGNLIGVFVVMGGVLGAVSAAYCAFARSKVHPLLLVAFAGCVGVVAEYLSQFIFPVNLAIVHCYSIPLLQIVSVTGVWGLSFLVWTSGAAVAEAVRRPRWVPVLAVLGVFVVLLYGMGTDRASILQPKDRVKVSVVQGKSLFDLAKYTEEAAGQGASAVLWPELAVDDLSQGVKDLSARLGVVLVTGFPEKAGGARPFNSAAVIARGNYIGAARKTHRLGKERVLFAKNNTVRTFRPDAFPKMGVAICFDTNFTDVTRRLAASGARVIFVPNSDPPSRSGALHLLHAALMPIRAAENSVVLLRADSSGVSEIIHPSGWVVAVVPPGEQGQRTAEVVLGAGPTIFTRMGDWFAFICMAAVAFSVASVCKRR